MNDAINRASTLALTPLRIQQLNQQIAEANLRAKFLPGQLQNQADISALGVTAAERQERIGAATEQQVIDAAELEAKIAKEKYDAAKRANSPEAIKFAQDLQRANLALVEAKTKNENSAAVNRGKVQTSGSVAEYIASRNANKADGTTNPETGTKNVSDIGKGINFSERQKRSIKDVATRVREGKASQELLNIRIQNEGLISGATQEQIDEAIEDGIRLLTPEPPAFSDTLKRFDDFADGLLNNRRGIGTSTLGLGVLPSFNPLQSQADFVGRLNDEFKGDFEAEELRALIEDKLAIINGETF